MEAINIAWSLIAHGSEFAWQLRSNGLACCAGIWVREGVFIVFFASIEAGEILLNQERKRPQVSKTDIFGDPDLISDSPHFRLISGD